MKYLVKVYFDKKIVGFPWQTWRHKSVSWNWITPKKREIIVIKWQAWKANSRVTHEASGTGAIKLSTCRFHASSFLCNFNFLLSAFSFASFNPLDFIFFLTLVQCQSLNQRIEGKKRNFQKFHSFDNFPFCNYRQIFI